MRGADRARSFAAIAEYAHDTGRTILDKLSVGAVVPHASTIRRVLQDLDPDAVEAAMRSSAMAQLADQPPPDGVPAREQRRVLALDGKTVRSARISSETDTGASGYRRPHLGVGTRPEQRCRPRAGRGRGQEQRRRRVHHAARQPGPD